MKSTIRTSIGAMVFVAFVAITWAVSNNGLHAQAINPPPPTELTVQVSEPVNPADTSNLSTAPTVNPLNDKMVISGIGISEQHAARPLPKAETDSVTGHTDTVIQTTPGMINMPAPDVNFEGISNVDGVLPPDTDGEVGPNHYVQMVNLSTAIYDKNGTLLYGPFHPSDLWPAGDACNTHNDGDPIVLYDQLSDRWLLTQFGLDFTNNLYYQCIAVSKTGVPTNVPSDWYPYTFLVHTSKMNDYPKLGVWPDGYYMSANQFTGGSSWGGAGVWAFDRAAMLTGSAATFQYFDLATVSIDFGGMLPSDLDGTTLPPAGAPNYFAEVDDGTWIGPNDAIRLWEFHVDWDTPANTTFGAGSPGLPNAILDTAPFDLLPCTTSGIRTCISQASSTQKLDSIGDRLMFRLAYRNFGDHESLVVNHTVWADGTDRAGVRWYEVRDPGGTPTIYQQGTYAPGDNHNRWMGSAAMDRDGNMAIGYSVSSSTLDPSIRYAGRLASDPLNTLPQVEETIITGSGAQTHTAARWGDYSAMSVDPVDDCTFWYTTEYVATTGSAPWQTRIASFKFPSCTAGDAGTLTGLVDDGSSGISGAFIVAQGISATVQTTANSSGLYTATLPVDVYAVTASAYGYMPSTITPVTIVSGTVTTQDFTLTPADTYTVDGVVTDGITGWPLYASIDISGAGYPGATIWTNPETGAYSIDLVGNITYTFNTEAWVGGYLAESSDVYPIANTTEDFALAADLIACTAPGYTGTPCAPQTGGLVIGHVYDENTSNALNGADVTNDGGEMAMTFATPLDDNVDDAFFTIFSLSGSRTFTATLSGGYGVDVQPLAIINGDTISQVFNLPSGLLDVTPLSMDITLEMGLTNTLQLDLSNTGSLGAGFELLELDKGMFPLGPFETPEWTMKPFKSNDSDARRVNRPQLVAAPLAAGDVIQSWAVTQSSPWGIAYDAFNDTVWIGEGWGDNNVYEYAVNGTLTGNSHPFAWGPTNGPADLAYNWNSGMLWSLDVAGDDCIHEIDPASGITGNTICPAFSTSQRGVTYDPSTDTYFAGSWNDGLVHRFDHTGAILASVDVGLDVSGLAYNPDTEHLFVMVNADPNVIFVLDVANGYALLGQFSVSAGFGAFSGAGLEFGSDGSLWAVDQDTNTVYQFDSGESSSLGASDVVWLSEDPITGTVSASGNTSIDVTFDAGAVTQPGVYHAQLKVNHDTPYALPNVPVTMTVTASAAFGKLDGTVMGLGYCDANPTVLADADVVIKNSMGMTTTLVTDAAGYYSFWIDETGSPVTVTVTAVDHASGMATGVAISSQVTTTVDFDLRWMQPCVTVSPQDVEVNVLLGETMTVPLTISNAGGASTAFELKERNGGFSPVTYAPTAGDILLMLEDVAAADWDAYRNALTAAGATWTEWDLDSQPFPTSVELSAYDILIWGDDGTLSPGDENCQGVVDWLNTGDKSFFATSVDFLWDLENGTVGEGEHNLYLMLNTAYSGDYAGNTIATLDGVSGDVIGNGLTLQLSQDFSSNGDYADETIDATTGFLYGTGGSGSGHSALTHYEGANYRTVWLGINFHNGLTVQAERDALMGNILTFLGVDNDMPWLSENPITGTVGIDSNMSVDLIFDSTVVTQTGVYTGTLRVMSDDMVNGVVEIPVTMHVTADFTIYLPAIMKP